MNDINDDEFELGIPIGDESENARDAKKAAEEFDSREEKSGGDLESDWDDDGYDYEVELGIEIEGGRDDGESPSNGMEGDEGRMTSVFGKEEESVEPHEEDVGDRLYEISAKLDALQTQFLTKLENDAFKDKLIDTLHRELQAYKNDLVKKHVQSIVMDVIKIIDDIRKLSEHYHSMKPEELEPAKLLQLLERIPGDLEDLFSYQGVKPFTCYGSEFDPSRQRVLKRIDTSDPLEDRKVAESLKPGYEWDGKIIRPEIVSVYLYRKTCDDGNIGTFDE